MNTDLTRRCLTLVPLLAVIASIASGQEQEPEWIRPEAVPGRADALANELEAMKATPAAREKLDEIQRGFADLEERLDELAARVDAELAGSPDLDQLEDMRRELAGAAAPLSGWH